MGTKTIRVCDGCGKELTKTSQIYRLSLKTDRFWNVVEMDYLEHQLEFCERCAVDIKQTLQKLAKTHSDKEGA